MCEEESDDTEAVEKLKQINDSIRRTIERYKLVKKGDIEGAAKIPKGTLGTTTGVSKNANNEFSLIDFDPEPSPNGDAQGTSSLENDLLGLSFQDKPAATSAAPAASTASTAPAAPPSGQAQAGSNYDILSSLASSQPGSQSATPAPSVSQPSKQTTSAPVDPFASLVSASPRAGSPFAAPAPATQQPSQPSSSLLDLAGDASSSAPGQTEANNNSGGDEEWTFTSSLPEGTLPSTNKVRVLNSALVIDFAARRNPGHDRQIHIVALFSNSTSRPLTELHFQVAVERVCRLHIFYLKIC